jgi:hypothetical protein
MQLHDILTRFAEIIRTYEVVQYEVVGLHSRLKLHISFVDDTVLHVRDIILEGQQRKYAFHWQEASGRLLARWDNAAHWPNITTYPHHKHVGEAGHVVSSDATTLDEVLAVICTHVQR